MNDDPKIAEQRAAEATRRGEEQVARLRRALDEDTARAADAARERREATKPLRRGMP